VHQKDDCGDWGVGHWACHTTRHHSEHCRHSIPQRVRRTVAAARGTKVQSQETGQGWTTARTSHHSTQGNAQCYCVCFVIPRFDSLYSLVLIFCSVLFI
jgi:hypothetical protein